MSPSRLLNRAWMRRMPMALALVAFSVAAQVQAQSDPANDSSHNRYSWPSCPQALERMPSPSGTKSSAPDRQWDVVLSPYTHHWNDNPEHKRVNLVAFDRYLSGNRFCGLALFTNSFGQPSAYAHFGQRWDDVMGKPGWFVKVSAGLIYGYKGAYKDKIPFNNYGIAPAIIPAIGYELNKRDSIQVMILGDAGFVLAWGLSF